MCELTALGVLICQEWQWFWEQRVGASEPGLGAVTGLCRGTGAGELAGPAGGPGALL